MVSALKQGTVMMLLLKIGGTETRKIIRRANFHLLLGISQAPMSFISFVMTQLTKSCCYYHFTDEETET